MSSPFLLAVALAVMRYHIRISETVRVSCVMTRRKKSRTPGTLGVKSQPKSLRAKKQPDQRKNPEQAKGKPAGNRHSLLQQQAEHSQSGQPRDPRVGSKRKIPLVTPVKAENLTAEQELAQLENDERLQSLLEQVDKGETLTPRDRNFVNARLARYQELAKQLGIVEEEDEEEGDNADETESESEDELEPWQKFENPKDWI
ncbi:Der GTPase-activating protein YihI [Aliidiomarina minuta]|nr:Der GTPase-activating protein YihI [Aliidiomarina minuta]